MSKKMEKIKCLSDKKNESCKREGEFKCEKDIVLPQPVLEGLNSRAGELLLSSW